MNHTIVEFPAAMRLIDITGFLKTIQTITVEHQQSDHLHHKFLISSKYPGDFVTIGVYIGYFKGFNPAPAPEKETTP